MKIVPFSPELKTNSFFCSLMKSKFHVAVPAEIKLARPQTILFFMVIYLLFNDNLLTLY